MEITVNIPQNDYVQPTEVKQHVVQAICEAFLSGGCWSTFHPFNDGHTRARHTGVLCHINGEPYGFGDAPFTNDCFIKFNGAEMKAAFKALIKAGYYIFRVYEYGTWMGYKVSKKPFLQGGEEVTFFNDFID